jgi:energy-converting hydrogenase Eha subunit A
LTLFIWICSSPYHVTLCQSQRNPILFKRVYCTNIDFTCVLNICSYLTTSLLIGESSTEMQEPSNTLSRRVNDAAAPTHIPVLSMSASAPSAPFSNSFTRALSNVLPSPLITLVSSTMAWFRGTPTPHRPKRFTDTAVKVAGSLVIAFGIYALLLSLFQHKLIYMTPRYSTCTSTLTSLQHIRQYAYNLTLHFPQTRPTTSTC